MRRVLKIIGLLVALAAFNFLTVAVAMSWLSERPNVAAAEDGIHEKIVTRRLVVRDKEGKPCVLINSSGIGILDGAHQTRVALALGDDGAASLSLRDSRGKIGMWVAVSAEGRSVIHLTDRSEDRAVIVLRNHDTDGGEIQVRCGPKDQRSLLDDRIRT